MRYRLVQLGNVTSHAHENSLGGQLKGPKPDFLEAPFPGLVVHDISGKGIVGLEKLSAMFGVVGHHKRVLTAADRSSIRPLSKTVQLPSKSPTRLTKRQLMGIKVRLELI